MNGNGRCSSSKEPKLSKNKAIKTSKMCKIRTWGKKKSNKKQSRLNQEKNRFINVKNKW